VRLYHFFDGKDEARIFSEEIETLQLRKVNLDEIAILVRVSHQMRAFEDRLIEMGLPYRVVGGPRFYERAEIRDANAYLRIIAQSQDNLAFERILNKPRRGLGKVSLGKLHGVAREEYCALMDASEIAIKKKILSPQANKSLVAFLQNIEEWKQMADKTALSELCEAVLKQSGYIDMWKQDKAPDAPGKIDNLYELIRSMNDFENLQSYLEHISLVLDIEQQDNHKGKVSLMTLHAAKGLEFEYVFLPGWEGGIFPHQRALEENGDAALEEERRLAYVGITRAKKRASLSFAGSRQIHGQWSPQLPSQFIDELPKPHIAIMSQVKREAPKPYQSATADIKANTYSKRSKYHKGDLVRHHKFGTGRIEHVEGKSLTIMFENIGRKKIIDNFVQKA
ncbi:MAG: ATP-dependent helicase, partial [Parvibaculales bacterium]